MIDNKALGGVEDSANIMAVADADSPDKEPMKAEASDNKKGFFTDDKGNLKFVNFLVRWPILTFAIMCAICIGSIRIITAVADEDFITEETNEYDLSDVRSIAYDSLKLAQEEVEEAYSDNLVIARSRGLAESARDQEDIGDMLYWIYEAKTEDGLFTKDAIKVMKDAESTYLEHPDYQKYCVLEYADDGTSECMKPVSALNIFYASDWDSSLVQEITSELTDEMIDLFRAYTPCLEFNLFCDDTASIPDDQKAWVAEMNMKIDNVIEFWDGNGDLNPDVNEVVGFMALMDQLETKKSEVNFFFDKEFNTTNPKTMFSRSIYYWGENMANKTQEESEDARKEFAIEKLYEDWNKITDPKHNESVNSYYFMGSLIFDIILKILINDAAKAGASFIAVFFYLRFMLGSWFLTAVGMFEIFMSLPLAILFYTFIFQIEYFSSLNVLCLFIVMAIGADDIFVFMDAYKQSASQGKDVLESMETRMTWVFRRSGSAMLLTSATTCAAFICTLASPIVGTRSFGVFAAFVILFDYVLVMTLFCSAVVIYHDRFEGKAWCCNCSFWVKNDPTPTKVALEKHEIGEPVQQDKISLFFKEKLGPFILKLRNRLAIFAVLITWIVLTTVYTSKLEPTTTAEQFLQENHPVQKGFTILSAEFPQTDNTEPSYIHFIWGLNDVNRDGVNQFLDPDFIGKPTFVDTFSFDEKCQTEMLKVCRRLQTDDDFEDFILVSEGLRAVNCFVEELGAFNSLGGDDNCDERRGENWLSNDDWQVSPSDTSKLKEFMDSPKCFEDLTTVQSFYSDTVGWDGTSLRYVGINFESSFLDPYSLRPEDDVRVHYDKFIAFAKEVDATMEEACGTKTIMTDLDQTFIMMNNQRIYRSSAVRGSMLGVLIAFFVIFLSTRKLHIAIFSTCTILCILVGVIGSITMLGWTLGTIEAILISILAGFSVDYVIHLAHAYVHAEGDVDERVIEAYGDMGISVFSGMLTSVVASIPLFFCTLTFFAKFGAFLCITIVLSWIFANFGFMAVIAQFKIPMKKGSWL